MNEIKEYTEKMFEYSKWERFSNAIDNGKVACKKMVLIGFKTSRRITDYKLSRYACY